MLLLLAPAPDEEDAPALERVVRVDARVLVDVVAGAVFVADVDACGCDAGEVLLLVAALVLALLELVAKGCERTTRGYKKS